MIRQFLCWLGIHARVYFRLVEYIEVDRAKVELGWFCSECTKRKVRSVEEYPIELDLIEEEDD